MKLPTTESCENDAFLNNFRTFDAKGYLSPKTASNQYYLNRRRIDYAYELLMRHLPKNTSLPVADFASGTANFGLRLAEDGYNVHLVDNEEKFFDYVKMKTNVADKIKYIKADASKFVSDEKYFAIFFGEALEHMENPEETLKNLHNNLVKGGLLCLTTPNGDFVDCTEPQWSEVKDQKERNAKLANNIGNHVCEFGFRELKDLVKNAGFGLLDHELVSSKQISRMSLLRRILPLSVLNKMDYSWAKKKTVLEKPMAVFRSWWQLAFISRII